MSSSMTVEGFRYQMQTGDMGAVTVTATVIYIPSRSLTIKSTGSLFRSAHKLRSIAAEKASRAYYNQITRERTPYDSEEHQKLMEEADIAVTECVRVPLEIVEQLEAELQVLEEIKKFRVETERRISEVSKKLF